MSLGRLIFNQIVMKLHTSFLMSFPAHNLVNSSLCEDQQQNRFFEFLELKKFGLRR